MSIVYRRLLGGLLALAAAFVLSGCGQESNSDLTPPTVAVAGPIATPTNIASLTLGGTKSADATVEVETDTTATATVTAQDESSWSALVEDLAEGNNTIRVTATDEAGNNRTLIFTVVFDQTAPEVSVDQFVTPTPATQQTVAGVAERFATVSVTVNGPDGAPVSQAEEATVENDLWRFDLDLTGLGDALYNVVVTAADRAGNQATTSKMLELSAGAPLLSPTDPPPVFTNETQPVIAGERTPGTLLTLALLAAGAEEETALDAGQLALPDASSWEASLATAEGGGVLNNGNNVLIVRADQDGDPATTADVTAEGRFLVVLDTVAPFVAATDPTLEEAEVPLTDPVEVTFSEAVDATTVNETAFTLAERLSQASVAGTVTYNVATLTATFTPAEPLAGQTEYTATVEGVEDLAGNGMLEAFSFGFVTAAEAP